MTDRTSRRQRPTTAVAAFAGALAILLGACTAAGPTGAGPTDSFVTEDGVGAATGHAHEAPSPNVEGETPSSRALRDGERRLSVAMSAPYRPVAVSAGGSDDYRCFLLDPQLPDDVLVTGTHITPGSPSVHHVILFHVPPARVPEAQSRDRETPGRGWSCFGGSGLGDGATSQPSWLAAWTPGSGEDVLPDRYGVPLARGARLVMQVHYNVLAGDSADVTSAMLRIRDADDSHTPATTMLLPAPVELPCRPRHDNGPLCDRQAALRDLQARFGTAGLMAEQLLARCPGASPGTTQSCTTTVRAPTTVIGVAGHMHLLGRSIRIEVNPGTDRARTILDISPWNFDDQGIMRLTPVQLATGDQVRVTCEHDQSLRDHLPAFAGQPDRYVLWGEGTTDEMCAGILQVAR